jgi:molecular chaperone GrpE
MSKVTEEPQKQDGAQVPAFRVEDRRHWARQAEPGASVEEAVEAAPPASPYPTVVEELRQRAEAAERKLLEYIDAFKRFQQDQEQYRERLQRDVDRRVALGFSEVLSELLVALDDLELAVEHANGIPEAKPLAEGVTLVCERFLATLAKRGVESIRPDGTEFDPNLAEAVRVDPVDDPVKDGKVLETLRPGYRLGQHVIRPARVAVGKHTGVADR